MMQSVFATFEGGLHECAARALKPKHLNANSTHLRQSFCCRVIKGIQNSDIKNLFNPENIFLSKDTPTGLGWTRTTTDDYSIGAIDPALGDVDQEPCTDDNNNNNNNDDDKSLQTPVELWKFFDVNEATCEPWTPQLPPGYERAEDCSNNP